MSMQSTNFEFLRQPSPEGAHLGGFSERYLFTDTNSALIKLRTFAENIVATIYQKNRFVKPYYSNFNDLLIEQAFIDCVPDVVVSKLHFLRINGNKAAHGAFAKPPSGDLILDLIKEAFGLGQWFFLAYAGGTKSELSEF